MRSYRIISIWIAWMLCLQLGIAQSSNLCVTITNGLFSEITDNSDLGGFSGLSTNTLTLGQVLPMESAELIVELKKTPLPNETYTMKLYDVADESKFYGINVVSGTTGTTGTSIEIDENTGMTQSIPNVVLKQGDRLKILRCNTGDGRAAIIYYYNGLIIEATDLSGGDDNFTMAGEVTTNNNTSVNTMLNIEFYPLGDGTTP